MRLGFSGKRDEKKGVKRIEGEGRELGVLA